MHLIPPDCSQEEVVVQLVRSLTDFQRTADQIFKKAAFRADKCRRRIEMLGKRMETLDRKMEVMEKLNAIPLLNCASNFPELGTPVGVYACVFDQFGHCAPSNPFTRTNDSLLPEKRPQVQSNASNLLNEAISRRKGLLALLTKERQQQQKERVLLDVGRIEKLSAQAETGNANNLEADFEQRILTRVLSARQNDKAVMATHTKSTQIDFSESLIDLCPSKSSGNLPMPFAIGMMEREECDPFAYEPTELDELADFDLPEDLPGIDAKNISFANEPASERRSDRLTMGDDATATHSSKTQPTKVDDVPVPSTPPVLTADSSELKIHALPPPPPPPPPSLQQKKLSVAPSALVSDRSDLMAAIRAAGGMSGAKLKKVGAEEDTHRERGGKAERAKTGTEEPDDLMSSLAKALEMRRKGMLGKTTATVATPKKPSGGDETLSMLRERVPIIRVESDETEEEEEEGNEWID